MYSPDRTIRFVAEADVPAVAALIFNAAEIPIVITIKIKFFIHGLGYSPAWRD